MGTRPSVCERRAHEQIHEWTNPDHGRFRQTMRRIGWPVARLGSLLQNAADATGLPDVIPRASWTVAALALLASLGAGNAAAQTPVNSPATGEPTISGIPRVGETLTAAQGDIADTNGLTTATFTYQWIRVRSGNESDITNATGTTYLLTADDLDRRIRVRASFTDDNGYSESRTSDAIPSGGFIIPDCPDEIEVAPGWALTPAGLEFGDRFRLIFVTSSKHHAGSAAIITYNNFVTTAARSGSGHSAIVPHGFGFRAVGSTESIDARDNTCTTGTGVPIYWLNGNKVADNYGDFYDGSWDDEANPKDEGGNSISPPRVWTGTGHDGTAAPQGAVLGRSDGHLDVQFGRLGRPGPSGPLADGVQQNRNHVTESFYGLSPVYVVAGPSGVENALVANFGQSAGSGNFNVLSNVSQSFTTGTHAGGYRIETIATRLTRSSSFSMSLCSTDSRSRPTSTCTLLTAPSSTQTDSPVVFTAPANTILEANTTHAVVLSGFHNRLTLDYTQSGGEDDGSADGWSIGDAYHLWHPGSRSWFRRSGMVLRLAVGGAPNNTVVAPDAPRNLAATSTGSTQVELNWDAPSANGGAAITDYEIRHAQGASVPGSTTWTSAGSDRTETVTGLTSGQEYTFEVRAVNSAGSGAAASVQATVQSATFTARFTNVPASHRGAADRLHYDNVGTNDFTFELHFSVDPTSLTSYTKVPGLLEVSGGDVLKARRLNPPRNLAWEVRVRPTQNGDIQITLPVRACSAANAVCASGQPLAAAVSATVKGRSLTASFSDVPPEHDGSTFTLHFQLSHEPDPMSFVTVRDSLFDVTDGAIEYVRRVRPGQNREWELRVRPSGFDDVTLTLEETTACNSPPGICAGGQMLPGGLTVTVFGPATLSVADASGREETGLEFRVTLSRPRSGVTTVQYATSAGTATAGADYNETSGTLTFSAGETSQTISVATLSDGIDDGGETMTVTLSNPTPSRKVRIADGTATGTIDNSGPIPQAWIARLGRETAEQVVEHVEERTAAAPRRQEGSRARFAGRELRSGQERDFALGLLSQFAPMGAGPADALTPQAGGAGMSGEPSGGTAMAGARPAPGGGLFDSLGMGGALFSDSEFELNRESRGGILSLWSRSSWSHFNGLEDALSLDGDVRTTMFGADWSREALIFGLSVGHTLGAGGYSGTSGGRLSTSMTGFYPWVGYRLSDRVSVWAVTGYGTGALSLTPDGQATLDAGVSMLMSAVGTRGELVGSRATGGFALAFKGDVLWAGTASTQVDGPTGRLNASEAAVTRLRTALEGSRGFVLGGGRVSLRPRVEMGLRRDGGEAETGAGMDLGSGLTFTDAVTRLSLDVRVRTLVVHQSEAFSDRGMSLSLGWDPTPGSPLGPTARVAPSWGGQAQGGAEALWTSQMAYGMGSRMYGSGGRVAVEAGYGLPVGARFVGTPRVGLTTSPYGRDYRLGYDLGLLDGAKGSFQLGVETQRRESPLDDGASNGLLGRATLTW